MPDNEKILKLQSLIEVVRNNGYRIITVKDISNSPCPRIWILDCNYTSAINYGCNSNTI
jgi:hypothetical protein